MRPTYLNCAVKLTSPILIARTLTIYPKKIATDDPINEAQATKVMGIQGSYTVAQIAAMNTPSPAKMISLGTIASTPSCGQLNHG